MRKQFEKLYSLAEISEILGTPKSTVYKSWRRWVVDGRIAEYKKIGRNYKFPESSVVRLYQSFNLNQAVNF